MYRFYRVSAVIISLLLFNGGGATHVAGSGSFAAPDDSIIGLWSSQTSFDTGLAGELTVTRDGARWHAVLDGAKADATASGNNVHLVFPGGGAFRGTFDRGVLRGFWVRPDPKDNPQDIQSYAGPLMLRAVGRGRWRATVKPLEYTFTLYLKVFRDADGTLKAAFRNPEQNSVGPARQLFTVTQTGDSLRFSARPNPAQPEVHLDATLLRSPDRIAIFWSDLNRNLELRRTAPKDGVRFFPRPPGTARYVYRPPLSTNDGWRVARAGDVGLDEAALARAVQKIIDIDPASNRPWMIHSIAVAYRGKLVLDEYFYGYGRDEPHDTRSAGKMFSSAILGGLMMDGMNISPATKVYEVMAPRGPFANPDPRKKDITLGHLLTHSAGLACDDNAGSSPGDEVTVQNDKSHPDWARVTLDLPMQFDPGVHYAYCSMNINLAGATLSQATGEWLPALFDRTIARPLQFGPYYWNLMRNREGYLGGGAMVRTRDFLKVGQAYLDGGVWNGRRIVTADWVKDSWAPHAHISPATTGVSGDAFRNNYYEVDEGWAWHMINVKSGDRVYPAYHTNGNGGQLLLVIPQFDLAVMFTAGNYGQGVWNYERDKIVGDMIIPAIR